jgi:hypothetical protein
LCASMVRRVLDQVGRDEQACQPIETTSFKFTMLNGIFRPGGMVLKTSHGTSREIHCMTTRTLEVCTRVKFQRETASIKLLALYFDTCLTKMSWDYL